jgi:hypothetical protein
MKVRELFLDENSAKQMASELSVNCMIEFTKNGPFITNNEYESLRDIIYNNILTALGF